MNCEGCINPMCDELGHCFGDPGLGDEDVFCLWCGDEYENCQCWENDDDGEPADKAGAK